MAAYNNIEIPQNADKFLFAEDLMRNVMLRNGSVPHFTRRAGPYRQFIHNGYNETTETAVRFLYCGMANGYSRVFQIMQNLNVVTREMYAEVVNDVIIVGCFPTGFHVDQFLVFCAHIASLAANFYSHGVLDAPDLAVLYIVKPIQDIDMTNGGWDSLNSSAHSYVITARNSLNI